MSVAEKKTVLITGCTPGGIGHELALKFHAKGYHVIGTARRADVLQGLKDLGMSAVSLDVTSTASINECEAEVSKITGGKLDILVNNAGLLTMMPAADLEMDDIQALFAANVFGVMAMCRAFIPQLIRARGLILNISSISSTVADLYCSAYSATKGALNAYSRTLRLELRPFNVRVMVAVTGTVKSKIASRINTKLPEDSIYKPVEDFYIKRHTFSQDTVPMDTDRYATKIVEQASKGEGYLGGWFGRTPDWYWIGGLSTRTWIMTFLPVRWGEATVEMLSEDDVITERIQAANAKI